MTDDEHAALCLRWQTRGDDSAREALLREFAPMISDCAFRLSRDAEQKKDLAQEGRLGFLDAIDRFDPAKGTFSGYAYRRLRGGMLHWIRDRDAMIRLPAHRHRAGERPPRTELFSQSETPEEPDGLPGRPPSPEEAIHLRVDLARAVAVLSEKERWVIWRHVVMGYTHAETGAVLGVGDDRVSQLYRGALRKLRRRLGG